MEDHISVNRTEYRIIKLLGHGKGGYSYLAERDGTYYVVKQIHHEPCDYYSFGNKIEAEYNDYHRLVQTGIRMPKMLDIDYFPTNFVVRDDVIHYINYECNGYMDQWNFENWGIKYWSKTPEFLDYLAQH